MTFLRDFTILEKIELLQRSILVNSLAYYELNENILDDFRYDANTRQLLELKAEYPEEFGRSKYYPYFKDFESGTGFDLIPRVKKQDDLLYSRLFDDAKRALMVKAEKH